MMKMTLKTQGIVVKNVIVKSFVGDLLSDTLRIYNDMMRWNMTLDEVSKRASKRALDRLKGIDNSKQPAMKRLEESFKRIEKNTPRQLR